MIQTGTEIIFFKLLTKIVLFNLVIFCQGVPVRIEVGPRDLKESQYVAVQRHNGAKATYKKATLERDINTLLEDIHSTMFQK